MYFTLMTPMLKGRELEQWQEIKDLVTNTILQHNGSVSHHHSVGADHQKWYKKYTDVLAQDVLKAVKARLDPKGIMNPGKLYS
jgi:alkyldihydroxyacetonephosphate synthase